MSDDKELGEDVLAVLLPLLDACTALRAGEPTRLRHRDGGLRVVLDVQLAAPSPVTAERVDVNRSSSEQSRNGGAPARRQRRRLELPPGG
ncbi:hypothetical protein [Streptomyces sp. NBUL23]|uniref:hypothetical protein n=1 Tax=Streptomyces sp. NBUL23 TaxID=3381354 RepID=UPI0038734FEC